MKENERWDISRALAIAGLFQFLHCVGKSCVIPFLTIYFRHLGLTPPLVGIIMGMKHLISILWAPLCSYLAKSHRRRRILICGSLLSSVGAGLLLTLIPPLHKEIVYRLCNVSLNSDGRLLNDLSNINTSQHLVLPTATEIVSSSPGPQMISLTSSGKDIAGKANLPAPSGFMKAFPTEDGDRTTRDYTESANTEIETALESVTRLLQEGSQMQNLEPSLAEEPDFLSVDAKNSSLHSALNISADDGFSGDGGEFPDVGSGALKSPRNGSRNLSKHWKNTRDVNFEVLQAPYYFTPEHKMFLMVLGAVILWELLAAPLEWTADDSLYEYLDFVDATDRHGRLWIWGYLGTSLGACCITVLVDHLSCFLSANIPRLVVHFYGYSVLITASLLVSIFYPIHVSKKTEHANKTVKALGLMGNDGRIILMAVTVFLTGAVGSTANNFLFWQMQDVGSCELYMGVSIAVALLAEILLYGFKDKLFKAFSSSWIMALSLISLAIQLLYYSFLWTSWAVMPIQILSAFSNGALWWVVNSLADDVATPGTERSLQMVLRGISYGCGASLGSFSSGFIVSNFSLAILYRACCSVLILWLALYLIVQSKLPRQRKINYSRLLAADASDLSDSDENQERDWLVKAMKDENTNKDR